MRYWWVNQSRTHKHEQAGGYLWSPKSNRNGAYNQFYENMKAVAPGDPVFCYWWGALRAYGIARSACYEAPQPREFGNAGKSWAHDGFKVDVAFSAIDPPLRPKDHLESVRPLLPEKYSPLNRETGDGLQSVYLAELPEPLARLLLSLTKEGEDIVEAAEEQGVASTAPDVAEASRILAEVAGRTPRAQGFGLSPAARRAVEARAMDVATQFYEHNGWTVVDVSNARSYDLVCSRGGQELHVEVKGTTGQGEKVLLPRNEVTHARKHYPNVALFIVYGIKLSKGPPPVATGGEARVLSPWDIDAGKLEPLAFSYSIPGPAAP